MRRIIAFCALFTFVFVLSSCRSAKEILPLSSLDGEWNIIELNGMVVVPAPNQAFPFIGFDTASGKVYGNSGCNRIAGSFHTDGKAGEIAFDPFAVTRMACPDMALEQTVLKSMEKVRKYKRLGVEMIALCGSSKHPVVVLKRRNGDAKK